MFEELQKSTKGLSRSSSKDSFGAAEQKEARRQSDQIKRLENTVSEFGQIIRQKNAQLDEAQRKLEKLRQDNEAELDSLRAQLRALQNGVKPCQTVDTHEKQMNEPNSIGNLPASHEDGPDQHHLRLIGLEEQIAVKQNIIQNLMQEKTHLMDQCRDHFTDLNRALAQNEELDRMVATLKMQLASVTQERDKNAADAMQQHTRATEATKELALMEGKWNDLNKQFETREASLQNKIAHLEDRLHALSVTPQTPLSSALTEDPSVDGSMSMTPTEDSSSTSEQAIDLLAVPLGDPNGASPTAAAGDVATSPENLNALLQERDLLTSRLESMRIHLAEAKTQWNECIASLERQVAHLNSKLAEDAAEYRKRESAYQSTIKSLKVDLFETNKKLEETLEMLRNTDHHNNLPELSSESQAAQWVSERMRLATELTALKTQVERTVRERSEAIQELMTIRAKEDDLQRQLISRSEALTRCEEELIELRCKKANAENGERTRSVGKNVHFFQSVTQQDDVTFQEISTQTDSDCENGLQETEEHISAQLAEYSDSKTGLATDPQQKPGNVNALESQGSTVADLHSIIARKDQVIKLQQKRMKEMRRMLAEHMKSNHVPSDPDSIDGLVTGWYPYSSTTENRSQSLERVSIGSACSWPPISSHMPNNPLHSTEMNSIHHTEAHFLPSSNQSSMKVMYPSTTQDSTSNGQPNSANVPPELVNFRYLRHVIIKFLLSRESEAVQLIRVLSTLLYLTAEEENLLHQSLKGRRSFFKSKPSVPLPNAHGQFAKIVPPSS